MHNKTTHLNYRTIETTIIAITLVKLLFVPGDLGILTPSCVTTSVADVTITADAVVDEIVGGLVEAPVADIVGLVVKAVSRVVLACEGAGLVPMVVAVFTLLETVGEVVVVVDVVVIVELTGDGTPLEDSSV